MRRRFFFLFLLLFFFASPVLAAGGEGQGKYVLWPPFLLFALWWLVRGGRRAGEKAANAYPKRIYCGALILAVIFFGFLTGAAPNPVAAVVAFFPWSPADAGAGALLALLFFILFALLGTKLICGWGCPFGALQELLYELPLFRRIKSNQLPFLLTMPVRTLFFGVFLFVTVGGSGLYALLDPFLLFDRRFGLATALAAGLLLAASFLVYRPFCQLFCPFGWSSWFLERCSLFGIRINRRTCVRCNACARACPLEAARGRLLASPIAADCFSCARCLRVCPAGAIDYGWRWRGRRGRRRGPVLPERAADGR